MTDQEKTTSMQLIDELAAFNQSAFERLNKINSEDFHTTCENFKNLAGEILCDMQMVSGTTVDFLQSLGAKGDQLKPMPIECVKFKTELLSVKEYIAEMLSYLD